MRIMQNIPALQAYNALSATNSSLQKSIARLSTGLRINSAADDAAGLAISEKMRAQIRGLDQASANAQDAISMIQTAEGALSETHSILQRMRELSVQAANDTLTQEDRSYIQLEIDQLREEVSRISTTTQFNKKKLLDGSAAVLWSSDDLATKAIVKGGLREIDQFGQKNSVEGNFKIDIIAEPGQAQIQKTDIFKVKHPNVIMNLQIDKNAGFEKIEINNLPAGKYTVEQLYATAALDENSYNVWKTTTASLLKASLNVVTAGSTRNVFVSAGGTYSAQGTHQVTFRLNTGGTTPFYYNGALHTGTLEITLDVVKTSTNANAWSFDAIENKIVSTYGDVLKLASATLQSSQYAADNLKFESFYGLSSANFIMQASSIANTADLNASILLEVVQVNTDNNAVTFRAKVNAVDVNGNMFSYTDENFMVTTAGVEAPADSKLGLHFLSAGAFKIGTIAGYEKGDKMVLNLLASDDDAKSQIKIKGEVNTDWPDGWTDGTSENGATFEVGYNVDAVKLRGKDVHFKNFYLNTANGTVYEGDVKISFNQNMASSLAANNAANPMTRATFDAAYIGQVAQGDVKLRDLDKFWDANGKFMLDDAQEITIVQGDGTKASLTLYSTDTLEDVRKKLNDAIAYGLGQSQYVSEHSDSFVSFVDEDNVELNTPDSVKGTFVVRSLVPGASGELNVSGNEDIIKALSLNEIQKATESSFSVSVFDAHSGMNLIAGEKVTGNILLGLIHPNIDVEFDEMSNIKAEWNEQTRSFDLKKAEGSYSTVLHLADNTTVFQVGANEGEDMGIHIGDMSARALGLDQIVVMDRDSAARSITLLDNAISKVSMQRARMGAYQNRLEHTINNLTTASTNTTAAESRIRDADMAKEMMQFTKLNILSQAGNSMMAQANQLPQNILSLLQ